MKFQISFFMKHDRNYYETFYKPFYKQTILGRVAWWLATSARKPKVPGSSPDASYVQR